MFRIVTKKHGETVAFRTNSITLAFRRIVRAQETNRLVGWTTQDQNEGRALSALLAREDKVQLAHA